MSFIIKWKKNLGIQYAKLTTLFRNCKYSMSYSSLNFSFCRMDSPWKLWKYIQNVDLLLFQVGCIFRSGIYADCMRGRVGESVYICVIVVCVHTFADMPRCTVHVHSMCTYIFIEYVYSCFYKCICTIIHNMCA